MNSDFEPPPKNWSMLASVGGVVTAVIVIAWLNFWSMHLSTTNPIQQPEISIQRRTAQQGLLQH